MSGRRNDAGKDERAAGQVSEDAFSSHVIWIFSSYP